MRFAVPPATLHLARTETRRLPPLAA